MPLALAALEFAYPWIDWREPVPQPDGTYACRVCLAKYGKDSDKIPPPFHSRRDATYHLNQAHNAPVR